MANIRVDLDYTLYDGAEIKFRSPVDCSQVTGLIVYYPGADGNATSKEFAFADAHGNNVGDIDHLFAENVVVKVILDVTTSMAFVQNADTNAYLEAQLAGKAPVAHNHAASDISSGTLSADRLPTVPITKGGLGGTDRLSSAKNLTNEAVSSPNYVVSLTNGWGKFGYTTMAQLMTALGAAPATPSVSSASNSYNYAHFAKIGKLVICTILPKVMTNTVQYEATITIPSGYRPSAAKTFTFWSNTAKNAGDSAGKVSITANTGGALNFAASYGFSVGEVSVTLCWATS